MAGSRGLGPERGRRGSGRGRGRRARSPSPACSPSPIEEETECFHDKYFEFVVPINDDPFGKNKSPDLFAQFLDGRELAEVQLRGASCGFCQWPVEVFFNGEGQMFLHTVCEKFARADNLEAGSLLSFLYECDGELSVKVFDDTSCRMHYHGDDNEGSVDEQN